MSAYDDPAYWKHFAPSGQWSRIDCADPRCVPPEEYLEFQEALRDIVPCTTFSHGLEKWEDVFKISNEITDADEPNEKARQELQWAAYNLGAVTHLIEAAMEEETGTEDPPFAKAVAEAKDVLQDNGIIYESWTETYLFKDPETGNWRSVPSERAAAIAAELARMPADKKKAWLDEDPCHRSRTLANLWSMNEVFRSIAGSKLWHAMRILSLEHEFRFFMAGANLKGKKRVSARKVLKIADLAARIGMQIGLSHQSINKKAAELLALELWKRDIDSGAMGDRASDKNRARRDGAHLYLGGMASRDPVFWQLSEDERTMKAMKWAKDRDKGQERAEQLFHRKGKLYSKDWFRKWASREPSDLEARKSFF